MSRLSFFFTTLIAAVPAAFLGYLCVAAFLFHSDALPPILMAVAGVTLLLCVAVVAMPVYVLLKSRGAARPVEDKKEEKKEAGAADEEAASEDAAADEEVAGSEDEDAFVEGRTDEFEDFDDTPRKK